MRSLKIVVLGDYKVGKTSILNQFVKNKFSNLHIPTVGFKILKKVLKFDDNEEYNIIFWDTGGITGQKPPIKQKIFKSADVAIIVLDSTCDNLETILNRWDTYIHENGNLPTFVIITKSDLISIKNIPLKLHYSDLPYFLVSAKSGDNINESIVKIISHIIKDKSKVFETFKEKISVYKNYNLDIQEIVALKELEKLIVERTGSSYLHFNNKVKKLEKEGFPILFEIDEDSFGISINNGYVSGMGLFNCNIETLPKSFLSFKFLKRLTLRCNPLNFVPEIILNLKNIEFLDLALSQLSHIPETIKNLENLNELHLENNILISLPNSFGKLKSIQKLHLENNPIRELPKSFCNLINLKELYLEAPCFFYKGNLVALPDNFGNLISLEFLDISSCELRTLPASIGNLEGLRVLDLYNNNLITLPNSIGNLKQLEVLNLEGNKLKALPDSLGDLLNLKQIYLHNNLLRKNASEKFKALALKSTGKKYDRMMEIADMCKLEEDLFKKKSKKLVKKKSFRFVKPLTYSGICALIGILTFLNVNSQITTSNILLWFLFWSALIINILIGLCIISTLSKYFKITVMVFKWRIHKYFDIFVFFYLIWSIRASLNNIFSIELIPTINFLFEFTIPENVVNFLANLGYNLNLTFLENIDLFFGHFYFKIFSIALVFWALYRNGLKHIKKTAFEEKENKNLWVFLLIGLFGAFSLAVMNYSNLTPFLNLGYEVGIIFGGWLFIWEVNHSKKQYFINYIILVSGGITIIWLLSLWNMILGVIISIFFISIYLVIRKIQNKNLALYL